MTDSTPLNILVSNDDGIFALGIRTLANTFAIAGHRVTVVCPDREMSATGHGLTLHQPIRANPIEGVFHPQVTAWACSGTPADCVKLAIAAIVEDPLDFVLSGINHGPNLGTDILYSGTVSAAMEGLLEGVTSVALSLASFTHHDFDPAAQIAQTLVQQLVEHPLPRPALFNVNIPAVATSEIRGIRLTRQGIRRYRENFEKRFDPRGKSYYWLAGEIVTDLEQPDHFHLSAEIPTDVQAIQMNYVTLTPLQENLTDVGTFHALEKAPWL